MMDLTFKAMYRRLFVGVGVFSLATVSPGSSYAVESKFSDKNVVGKANSSPECAELSSENFTGVIEKMQDWLNIEQISSQDGVSGDGFIKFSNYLQGRGIKISEDREEAQVIRFSLKETVPESVKETIREKMGQPFLIVAEVRPVYKDGQKIGHAKQFSSDIFGASAVVDISIDGKESILVLNSNGDVESVNSDGAENVESLTVDKNRSSDSTLRFKRSDCDRCQTIKATVCGGGPAIWQAINGIKSCLQYCLRLGPNVAAGVCSTICAVVLGSSCFFAAADVCDRWC